ncbi:MAG: glycosyltransferase family 4 protein [Bacteroidetes bacterium]|nr:glycosyltransferase family 4 protein [Bacteroidota bacterium]
MSIIIFGDLFTFPDGNAATNRVYTYARGFAENAETTHVICFRNDFGVLSSGDNDGISFYHPFSQKSRSNYLLVRRWQKFEKFIQTYRILKSISKIEKIEAINIWTNLHTTLLFGWFLSRIFRARLIFECSEHPLNTFHNHTINRRIGLLKFKIESGLCDGVLCISKYLMDFYSTNGVADHKLLLVPSTVEPARFARKPESPLNYKYIGYFGSLSFERDNVDNLLKAFALIKDKHPEIRLVLGGFCNQTEKAQIDELISLLGISEKTAVIQYLSRKEIVQYIVHAEILVMVRSNNIESNASYPSKLTEYIAAGVPVISVNTGEISNYLKDGVDILLVEPENHEALASKIEFVIDNYADALEIAVKGQQLTKTVFNYSFQAKRMIDFINHL